MNSTPIIYFKALKKKKEFYNNVRKIIDVSNWVLGIGVYKPNVLLYYRYHKTLMVFDLSRE